MARMGRAMQDYTSSSQKALNDGFHVLPLCMGQTKGSKKCIYNLYFDVRYVLLNNR